MYPFGLENILYVYNIFLRVLSQWYLKFLWSEEDIYNVYNLEIFTMGMSYFNKSAKKSMKIIHLGEKQKRLKSLWLLLHYGVEDPCH